MLTDDRDNIKKLSVRSVVAEPQKLKSVEIRKCSSASLNFDATDCTVQQNETFFLFRNIHWVILGQYIALNTKPQTVCRHHPQFLRNSILKKMQIFNFEHLLCRNDNSYSVARCVKLFYKLSRVQRYKLLLHYEHLNMFKQRSKGKGYPKWHPFLKIIVTKNRVGQCYDDLINSGECPITSLPILDSVEKNHLPEKNAVAGRDPQIMELRGIPFPHLGYEAYCKARNRCIQQSNWRRRKGWLHSGHRRLAQSCARLSVHISCLHVIKSINPASSLLSRLGYFYEIPSSSPQGWVVTVS